MREEYMGWGRGFEHNQTNRKNFKKDLKILN